MMSSAEISRHDGAGNLGTTIEIKIKTMDSQTHTLRVDKQVPVPTLKEQIASVTGVVKEQQRLICRGRVLKDDQLLSAYHVEDGHTLHLVVREPPSSSMENLSSDPAFGIPSGGRSEYYQIAPGVVVESFNMHGQGERGLPDIGRIVSAVLGSIGITGPGDVGEGNGLREHGLQTPGRMPVRGNTTESNQPQPEQPSTRNRSDRSTPRNAFGVPTSFSFEAGQAPVIPDAVSTLSEYLINMQREFGRIGELNGWPAAGMVPGQSEADSAPVPVVNSQGLPTPASLAELLFSTRHVIDQITGECLSQLARQVLIQERITDPDARLNAQSNAWRTGVLFQNMGAYLLELGRTIMTLRLGRSPSEAVLNAGPAIFISSSGPNPLMVQPLPFHPGASFGATPTGTSSAGPSLSPGFGSGLLPRRIDIHIRRARQAETDSTQQPSGQQDPSTGVNSEAVTNEPASATSTNPSLPVGASARVLPTMVSALPAIPDLNHVPSDSSSNPSGVYIPLFGRLQSMTSQNTSSRADSHLPTEQNVIPEAESVQQQNVEIPPTNGHGDRPISRTIDISIFSSGGTHSEPNPDGQAPPDGVLRFLRGLFPGGEVHLETSQGAAAMSYPDRENSTRVQETESRPTEVGIFLSGLLQQIMPFISQLSQNEAGPSSSTPPDDSEAGNPREQSDSKLDEPNVKRQKME